ncbi:MAG: hypothetical protein ACE37F_00805 [Nannocystaceae bacterium]|nr:hypothetical protein [bacterium]
MNTAAQRTRAKTAAGYVRLFGDTKAMLLRAKDEAVALDAPELRVLAMQATLDILRKLINLAISQRGRLELGEHGLGQLDRDLAGLRARYGGVYGRWVPSEMDPPAQWDAETWEDFEESLEGPVLTWSIEDCRARWGLPFLPPCQGPDLLLAVQTVNGIAEAQAAELDMKNPLISPVGAIYAHTHAFFLSAAEFAEGEVRSAILEAARAADDIAQNVGGYFGVSAAAVKAAFPWLLGAGVGLGAYALWRSA